MRSASVVITGAGTVTCQSVIKALRVQNEIDVRIVTLDASEYVAGRYFADEFHCIPPAKDPAFVGAVLDACRVSEADLLIPIVDYEFKPLSEAIPRFERIGCLVGVSPPQVIERVNNKLETARFFAEHGFSSPHSWTSDEAAAAKNRVTYPLFIKPALDGRSSIDCYRVDNAGDLESCLTQVPNAIVQEYIDAPEFTADVLADWQSNLIGVVVRERLETKGGVSYKGRTVSDPEMEAQVARLVRALGIRGPANIQAFRRLDEVLFIEINPRFSGALALSLAAGLNSPLLLLKLALGLPVPSLIGQTRIGLTMLRYWDEVFVDPDGSPEFPDYHLQPSGGLSEPGLQAV